MKKTNVIIGKQKEGKKPSKKYRVIVQEKPVTGNKNQGMKSFMIYDYTGRSTINSIKNKLNKFMEKK
jgi:hypothetical protein